jgi:DNA invertase Pin-like site-specific DNA recombinase
MSRTFGYLRLSREREASTSIEKQRSSIEATANARGWHVVKWFEDVDISGRRQSRPGLDAMLEHLDEVDVIAFHRLDRIMRSAIGFAKLLERCQSAGVELVSVTEPFDTSTAIGRTLIWLLASIAEIEAENVSARIKATHEHLIRQGRPVGGARAFGWRSDPELRTFVHVPDEVELIRRMAAAYLAGEGLQRIAQGLNDGAFAGVVVPSPRGGLWTSGAVRRVLSNRRLIGYLTRHGKPATDEPTLEPILDPQTFRTLQAELARRQRSQVRVRTGAGELTGILVCGFCGRYGACERRLYIHRNNSSTAYTCTRARDHALGISAPFVHEELARRLFRKLDRDKLAAAETAELAADAANDDLRSQVARLEWGRDELMRDYYQEGRLSREDFEGQLEELTERLEQLKEKISATVDVASLARGKLTALGDLEALWPGLDPKERRMIFAIALERVVVAPALVRRGNCSDPDRLTIYWRL